MKRVARPGAAPFAAVLPTVTMEAQERKFDIVPPGWSSVAMPDGYSPEIVCKMSAAFRSTLLDPAVVKSNEKSNFSHCDQLGLDKPKEFFDSEHEKFRKVAENAAIALNSFVASDRLSESGPEVLLCSHDTWSYPGA